MEKVILYSEGYSWVCPKCNCDNYEEEPMSTVKCDCCDMEFIPEVT